MEFAIKLPGKDDHGKEVYLPIDAKFPQEDYVRLQTAYDEGDADQMAQDDIADNGPVFDNTPAGGADFNSKFKDFM